MSITALWRKSVTSSIALVGVLGVAGSLVLPQVAFAATGSIYLSPSSTTVSKGKTFTLTLKINPGTSVDAVQGNVTYDTGKLSLSSVSTSGTAFGQEIQNVTSSGTVKFARGVSGSDVTASGSIIEKITFKALAGSGSTSVGVSAANADHLGNFTDPSNVGATVHFTTPTTTTTTKPPTTTTTKPSTTTTKPSTTTAKPTTITKKPTATSTTVSVTDPTVQYSLASLTATSPQPTKVYVKYGLGDELTFTSKISSLNTKHTFNFDPANLVPGQTYSYVVYATNKQGKTSQTTVRHFTTKGLTVKISVQDKNHKALKNATVMLHSTPMTAKTDENGVATFTEVAPGNHELMYTVGGKSYTKAVKVVNNVVTVDTTQTADPQNLTAVLDYAPSATWWSSAWFISLLLIAVVAGVAVYILRRPRFDTLGASPVDPDTIVVGGANTTPAASDEHMFAATAESPADGASESVPAEPATSPAPAVTDPTPTEAVEPVTTEPANEQPETNQVAAGNESAPVEPPTEEPEQPTRPAEVAPAAPVAEKAPAVATEPFAPTPQPEPAEPVAAPVATASVAQPEAKKIQVG